MGNNYQTDKLKSLQNCLTYVIDDSKHSYYSRLARKLLNIQRNSEPYWFILETFLNNKKVTIIHLYFMKMNLSRIFLKKFIYSISLISKDIKLPSRLHYFTEKRSSTIEFWSNDIFDIIQQLDWRGFHTIKIKYIIITSIL